MTQIYTGHMVINTVHIVKKSPLHNYHLNTPRGTRGNKHHWRTYWVGHGTVPNCIQDPRTNSDNHDCLQNKASKYWLGYKKRNHSSNRAICKKCHRSGNDDDWCCFLTVFLRNFSTGHRHHLVHELSFTNTLSPMRLKHFHCGCIEHVGKANIM